MQKLANHTFTLGIIENHGLRAWEEYRLICSLRPYKEQFIEFPYRDNLGTLIEVPKSGISSYGWPHCSVCGTMLVPPKPRVAKDGERTIPWEVASGYSIGYRKRTW